MSTTRQSRAGHGRGCGRGRGHDRANHAFDAIVVRIRSENSPLRANAIDRRSSVAVSRCFAKSETI